MSGFKVSNSVNPCETIEVTTLLELFQRLKPIHVKLALNQPPISSCSTVSVVSYIIHSVNETQKLSSHHLRACVYIVIGLQDYTEQFAARSFQRLQHDL